MAESTDHNSFLLVLTDPPYITHFSGANVKAHIIRLPFEARVLDSLSETNPIGRNHRLLGIRALILYSNTLGNPLM